MESNEKGPDEDPQESELKNYIRKFNDAEAQIRKMRYRMELLEKIRFKAAQFLASQTPWCALMVGRELREALEEMDALDSRINT